MDGTSNPYLMLLMGYLLSPETRILWKRDEAKEDIQ